LNTTPLKPADIKAPKLVYMMGADARTAENADELTADDLADIDAEYPQPGLSIKPYGMGVRMVKTGFDLICEVFDDGRWREEWRTNEMSNGLAYSQMEARCLAEVAKRTGAV
jgi:hypothetical protein